MWGFALFGFGSAIYDVQPKLTVTPGESLDPKNPFATIFSLANDGVTPVYHATVLCGIGEIAPSRWRGSPPDIRDFGNFPSRIAFDGFNIPDVLWPGQRVTTRQFCSIGIRSPKFALVAVIVQYSLPISLFKRESIFPFVTERAVDGHLVWESAPT